MKELTKSIEMAEAIKSVLRARNLSKAQFAELMGEDLSVVREWLSGTYRFNLPILFRISERLNLL
ncbi:helix-turn-helix transcriptional regulator [Pedobacter sp. JY14-1]|uniref:helix-turn-helix domain-containing protein n=1 Tax=Pedobacter sp. JY14-1 TaxID=3034151 RepID=UPI0023E1E49E|nr:helix-turn-helix transcriptional regulator [Pedobacter sp. JY14-1]